MFSADFEQKQKNKIKKNAGQKNQILQKSNSKSLIAKVRNRKANIDARVVEQIQVNPKYNKNTTLIRSLSSPYIWKQHGIPEKK